VDYTTTNADSIPKVTVTTTNETFVCPYCSSNEYTEIKEQTPDIEAVYIYDLTSGPQDALNVLLADGYKIVSRYAKQYFLEKPKVEPAKDYVTEAVEKAKEAK
jgi:hypothetical protein